jgi:2-dehydro-3-deoxygluconokinase
MTDVVTFGETMLRLSPPDFQRLEQATSLNVSVGGSELTVAAGVARLGLSAAWVSRLPDNALGRMVRNKAREMGVDTQHVVWCPDDRLGLYFVEYGASPRASSVLYDRSSSAISRIRAGEIAWERIFEGCRLFHVSGITPALSDAAAEVTAQAVRAAKKAGALVSYDLNYRAKLGRRNPSDTNALHATVDVLITTEEDPARLRDRSRGTDRRSRAGRRFSLSVVAITLRTPSVWRNTWSSLAYARASSSKTSPMI